MYPGPIILLNPPGWTLNVGGPHIALSLLQGFLVSRGVPVILRDLNISAAMHFGSTVRDEAVRTACRTATLESLNTPYFAAQDALDTASSRYAACWDIQTGFNHQTCDLASSESVRVHTQQRSPFSNYFLSEVIPFVKGCEPSIVGISVTVPGQLLTAFELCRLLKKSGFEGKIIVGGNTITRIAENMLLDWVFEVVDGLAVYQGEETLLGLWHALAGSRDFHCIPNLIWKDNGEFVCNERKVLAASDFEGPDFSGLCLEDYWGIPYLPMIASRGCYYGKCNFCAIPLAWGNRGFIGNGKPEDILQQMKRSMALHGVGRFKFVDEALHPRILKTLAELILADGLHCCFEGYARFDRAWSDNAFLHKVTKAGLRKLYLGLELYPTESRAALNKSDSPQILETLNALHEAGVKVHTFCMFGFPGTGVDEALLTIEFVMKHRDLFDTVDIFPFYYAKGTKVDFIKPIFHPEKDWALDYPFEPVAEGVLGPEEGVELAAQLEDVLWRENPLWLHPTYRMSSPWQES